MLYHVSVLHSFLWPKIFHGIDYISLIHSSVDRHSGCFYFLTIAIDASYEHVYRFCVGLCFHSSSYMLLEVELLYHKVILINFLRTAELFSNATVPPENV
jgi:hypothetical protein